MLQRFADWVDGANAAIGRVAAWLYVPLIGLVALNVALRYGFSAGRVDIDELQWHLFAAAFLLAFAWTYRADEHVRIDVIARRWPKKARAVVEILGVLFLLLPFCVLFVKYGWDFFWTAFQQNERSNSPLGLPWRWVLKFVLVAGVALLLLQGLAALARSILVLRGGKA
jgi:TRAP-type mannitol/chloroaromatic compound transport system permease small subunit